jgi:hypothetical protein
MHLVFSGTRGACLESSFFLKARISCFSSQAGEFRLREISDGQTEKTARYRRDWTPPHQRDQRNETLRAGPQLVNVASDAPGLFLLVADCFAQDGQFLVRVSSGRAHTNFNHGSAGGSLGNQLSQAELKMKT